MSISLEEVRHVARLARLQLDEAEMLALKGELDALIGHFSDIQGIEVAPSQPQSHAAMMHNVWAEDMANLVLTREEAIKNAPASKAGLFVVATIIED